MAESGWRRSSWLSTDGEPAVGGWLGESSQVRRRKIRFCVGYTVCSLRRDKKWSHKG